VIPTEATADRLARARLWNGLRLLVLDIETAVGPDGQHRIVSIAAVTCRGGRETGRWSRDFVNPGVPIDPITSSIHLLTDADVRDAPSFAMIANDLAPLLRALPDETLVVVAHVATFDVPVLRAEMERAGATMPDLPVLDTARGLAPLAGIEPRGRSLDALLDACGLTNAAPHTAIGDAEATAKAACLLLDRAAGPPACATPALPWSARRCPGRPACAATCRSPCSSWPWAPSWSPWPDRCSS